MNEPTTTPGAEPAPVVEAPQPGAQPAAASPTTPDFSSQTREQLASLISEIESPPKPPAATATPPAAPETPPPGEQPAAALETPPEVTPTTPADQAPPNRVSIRTLDPGEQAKVAEAMALVRNGTVKNFADAWQQVSPNQTAPPATPTTPETPAQPALPTQPATPPEVARIETELARLREERRIARTEDFDNNKVEELTVQIEDLVPQLTEARIHAETRQSQAANYSQGWASAVDTIETRYPELQQPDSPFSELLDGLVLKARAERDPALADPNHLVILADKVAGILKTPAATTPQAPATPIPDKPKPAPAGATVAPGHTPASRPTVSAVVQAIHQETSRDKLADAIRMIEARG